MTPDERQMISDLFDRLRSMAGQEKDREAEAYIAQLMRQTPDSAYLLAQQALMQGFEIEEAQNRIADLEQQIQGLTSGAAPAPRGGGSFLGRGAAAAGAAGAAMGAGAIGARATPMAYGSGRGEAPAAQPWGNASGGFQGRGAGMPQTAASLPPGQPMPPPVAQPQRSGGGFLKGAMAAAAGVAGGVLMADALRGMFGGSSAQAAGANTGANDQGWSGDGNKADDNAGYDYKDEDGSNDQGDSGWSDGGDTET